LVHPTHRVPASFTGMKVETDPSNLASQLPPEERMILEDHSGLKCLHALIQIHRDSCYLVASISKKKGLPVIHLDYISNIPFFTKRALQISTVLCWKWHAAALMVGDHFFPDHKPPLSLSAVRKHPLLFRSNCVSASEMDTLYSEIQLLGIIPV
jgi:hypothetical protein